MKGQPQLQPVPQFQRMLTIKADLNGITVLKEGRYRKRYVGSKQYSVDINGVLRTSADLKKLVARDAGHLPKKMAPPKGRAGTNKPHTTDHKDRPQPSYTVNKVELRQRLYAMIASQPKEHRELYFWTVTFPAGTADDTAYQMFNAWLTRLRKEGILHDYIWVAERQTGERLQDKTKEPTNTIHFHIAIPHKMPVKKANAYMRATLITYCKKGMLQYSVYAAKRYNGVDIAKNRKERKVTNFAVGKRGQRALTTYITKYITKNDGRFTHLAWHNSRGFSKLFTGVTLTEQEAVNFGLRKYVRVNSAIKTDFFQWHPWVNGPPVELEDELQKLNSFIQNLN